MNKEKKFDNYVFEKIKLEKLFHLLEYLSKETSVYVFIKNFICLEQIIRGKYWNLLTKL